MNSQIKKFQKKPVTIEAIRLDLRNLKEVKDWCGGEVWSRPPFRAVTGLTISTLEGKMNAEFGDWIIKGVKGEFYPCKPDIFDLTYEESK
jgi:hypothetical protein